MDERLFRDAMGRFATGVTVILTEVQGKKYGMTVNAFMSVSLDPMLVLISIKKDSYTLEKIRESGAFSINILAERQKELSDLFASKNKTLDNVQFDRLRELPVLPGALAHVTCEVSSQYEEGDHILVVGKVNNIQIHDGDPLIFYKGSYRKLNTEHIE